MSWYDPTSWDWSGAFGVGSGDPSNTDRQNVRQTGNNLSDFGDQARGGYGGDTAAMQGTQTYLQGLMSGQNSVSAEQLRQGLQQQLAQQQSMAASASPGNAAMAARNAAMNMGHASTAMAGNAAMAGLQERNQAASQLAGLQLGMRGQDLQGTLGGYNGAAGAYGAAMGNPQKTWGSYLGPAISGAAAAAVKSDKRAKKEIEDGGSDATRALEKLRAKSYRYKDERDGKGRQFGIMAQDLEGGPLASAVIDTPHGKYVDGGKAALAGLGLAAELHRRISKLEGKGK